MAFPLGLAPARMKGDAEGHQVYRLCDWLIGFLALDETGGWVLLANNFLKHRDDLFAVGRGVWQVSRQIQPLLEMIEI